MRRNIKDAVSIEIRSWSIVLGMGAFASVALISVYRSAHDRRELQEARDQAKILQESLIKLNSSFDKIKLFTRSTEDFADSAYVFNDPVKDSDLLTNTKMLEENQMKRSSKIDRKIHYTLSTVAMAPIQSSPLNFAETLAAKDNEKNIEIFARSIVEIENASKNAELIIGRLRSISTILQYGGVALNSIPSLKPVEGKVTSDFGTRFSPFDGKKVFHTGVDIAAPLGASVKAPALGKVVYVGSFASLGNTVVIDHGSGTSTRFGHLKKSKVKIGQIVNKGDEIGWVGMTGNTTGPHLHYEVWLKNTAVNPREFFFDLEEAPKFVAEKLKVGSESLGGMGGE